MSRSAFPRVLPSLMLIAICLGLTGCPSTETPTLQLDKQSLDFGTSLTELTVGVSNSGTGTLQWTVKVSPADATWLEVDKVSGTGEDVVKVTVDRTRLPKSTAFLIFKATNGTLNELSVSVTAQPAKITDGDEGEAGPPAIITMGPDPAYVGVGQTFQMTGWSSQEGDTLSWFSSNTAVATINPATGLVTGLVESPNPVTITARGQVSGSSATAQVHVVRAGILAPSAFIAPQGTMRLTATSTSLEDTPFWSSSDESVAIVDPDTGVVTGLLASPIPVTITARGSVSGISASTQILVVGLMVSSPRPYVSVQGTLPFVAMSTLAEDTFSWTSSDGMVATVNPDTGVVSGVSDSPVPVTITATGSVSGISVTALIRVVRVSVSGPSEYVFLQGTLQLGGTSTLEEDSLVWTSSDSSVASVDPETGVVSGVSASDLPVTITATGSVSGASGSAQFRVVGVTVSSPSAYVAPLGTLQLTAMSTLAEDLISWASDNPGVASVNAATGLVTGVAESADPVTITAVASVSGFSASAEIQVVRVSASGPASYIAPQGTLQLSATSSLEGDTLSWTSSDPSAATVDPVSGMVTGILESDNSVVFTATGSVSGISAATQIRVVRIDISSPTSYLGPEGDTLQLEGTSTLAGEEIFWTSSDETVAAVDSETGFVVGGLENPNPVKLTATGLISGISATREIRVAKVVIFDPSVSVVYVEAQHTRQLFATSIVQGDVISWASSNPSVASVDPATGLVTGLTADANPVTITASGSKSKSSSNLLVYVVRVSMADSSAFVALQGNLQLSASSTLTDDVIVWTSTSSAVAPVDSATGLVTGAQSSADPVTITATGSVSGFTASRQVRVVGVSLSAPTPYLAPQSTLQLTGSSTLAGDSLFWVSSNPSVALVNLGTGLVTALAASPFPVTITATGVVSGISAATQINVVRINLSSPENYVATQGTLQLSATSTLLNDTITWTSSHPSMASVDAATGLVMGLSAGASPVTITATGAVSGFSASLQIHVVGISIASPGAYLEPGHALQLAATSTLAGDTISWTSSDPSVASVDAATGLVTGVSLSAEPVTITASGFVSGISATVQMYVGQVSLSSPGVYVTPFGKLQFFGESSLPDDPIVWTSSDPATASVDPITGLVTGVTANPTPVTITATGSVSGLSASAQINVVQVTLLRPGAYLAPNNTMQLTGTSTLPADTIVWSSSNPLAASVEPATGLVTGLSADPEPVIISATGSVSGLTAITRIIVVEIAFDSPRLYMAPQETQDLVASSTLAEDTITWKSSDPTVASVNLFTGRVTALTPSSNPVTITAIGSVSRIEATLDIYVVQLSISNPGIYIAPQDTLLLTASSTLPSDTIVWSSSDPEVAEIDPATGWVTGVSDSPDPVFFTATGSVSGFTALTSLHVVRITVSAPQLYVAPQETLQCTAVSSLDGDTVTWTSSNPAVASVDPVTGLVTGLQGSATPVIIIATGAISGVSGSLPIGVANVAISTPSLYVQPQGTLPLSAVSAVAADVISWTSSDPSVASVDPVTGLLTGLVASPNPVTITATGSISGFSDQIEIHVVQISLSSPNTFLAPQGTLQLTGSSSFAGDTIVWTSSNPSVASVDPATGLVTGVLEDPNPVTITATGALSGFSASTQLLVVRISVTSPNPYVEFQGTLQLTGSSSFAGDTIAWTSSNPSVASVDPATGLVSGVLGSPNPVTITATGDLSGFSATTQVHVVQIEISSPSTYLAAQETLQLTGTSTLSGDTIGWTSSNPAVASVDPATGLVTGLAASGTPVTITATGLLSGFSATLQIQLAQVSISSPSAYVAQQGTLQMTAASTLPGDTIAWSSSNSSAASVDPATGLVTGLLGGADPVTITATGSVSGLTATTEIRVVRVTLTAPGNSMVPQGTMQLTASSTLIGDTISWASSDPAVVSVNSATGLATAVGESPNPVTITATGSVSGVSDSTQIRVTQVAITAPATYVAPQATLQLSAASATVGDTMSWTSSNPAIASVDPATGLVTGVAEDPNAVTITATGSVSGFSDSIAIHVVRVSVSSPGAYVAVEGTLQLSASSSLADDTVFWTSSDPLLATVDHASGLVTGVSESANPVTITATGSISGISAGTQVRVVRLSLSNPSAYLAPQGVLQLSAASSLAGDTISFASGDPTVASVNPSTGLVTGILESANPVTLTATGALSGLTASTQIHVVRITLSSPSTFVTPQDTLQLTAASSLPGDTISFASSDPTIASVDPDTGLVTGLTSSANPVTLTATGAISGFSASVEIHVVQFTLTSLSAYVAPQATLQLSVTSSLTGETITFTSSDPAVASVNPTTGLVTGLTASANPVTMTATGTTSGFSATTQIYVVQFTLTSPSAYLEPQETLQLTASSTLPGDTISFTSSNPAVASVDFVTGLVTANATSPNAVTITAAGAVSGFSASTQIHVTGVNLSSPRSYLAPQESVQLTASSTLPGDTISFVSSDPAVASVGSGTGLVTAHAASANPVTITATGAVSGLSASVQVRVVGVSASSPGAYIAPLQSLQLTGTSTLAGDTISWTSSDPGVASVNSISGLVTGLLASPNSVTLTATGAVSGLSASVEIHVVRVSVSSPGAYIVPQQTLQLAGSSTLAGDTIAWTSNNPAVASVDPATGLVTGQAASATPATITATGSLSGFSASTQIRVVRITLSSPGVYVAPQGTLQLTASSTLSGDTIAWTSSNPDVASINPVTGLVTGQTASAEAVTMTAVGAVSGFSASTQVQVVRITLTSPGIYVMPQGTLQLAASSTLPGDTITWTTSNSSVASVNLSTGLVTGLVGSPNAVTITAKGALSGFSVNTQIFVSQVSVTSPSAYLAPQGTLQLTASSSVPGDTISFTSSDPAVASVNSATGLVTGQAASPNPVTITSSGSASGFSVNIQLYVVRVSVVAPDAYLAPQATMQCIGSSTLPGDSIAWTSSDPAVASVDPFTGLVTGLLGSPNPVTITATGSVSGFSASAQVNIVTIGLSSPRAYLAPQTALQLTGSSSLAGDTLSWTSSNPSVASVNSTTGLVTGQAASSSPVTITATGALTGFSSSIPLNVVRITLSSPSVYVAQQNTLQMTASSTLAGDTIVWTSSNDAVAAVNSAGLVTGVAGSADPVTIVATGFTSGISSVFQIHVVRVSLAAPANSVLPGGTLQLTASSSLANDTISFTSSDPAVASVNSATGLVSGLVESANAVTITARGAITGFTATVQIRVAAIAISSPSPYVLPLGTLQLQTTAVQPGDTITWSSSNPATASIDPLTGLLTGVAASSNPVTITASGSVSGIAVTTNIHVVRIAISSPSTFVAPQGTLALSGSSTLAGDTLQWTSSDTTIATVNAGTGLVKGATAKTTPVTITARSALSGFTATTQVYTVRVTMTSTSQPLPVGKPERFAASSTYAGDTAYTWSSDNTAVATVDSLGVVRAVALGTATIRVTANVSGIGTSKSVTVVEAQPNYLIFDGETPFTMNTETQRNVTAPHNGGGCLDGLPTLYKEPDLNLQGLSSSRADISGFDEIWFFARATETGRTINFATNGQNAVSNRVDISPYIAGGALDTTWRLVRIPISALVTPTYLLSRVDHLYFGKASGTAGYHVFVDDMWAVNTDVVNPATTPLVIDFKSLHFGDVAAGTSSAPQNATIRNIGAVDLVVNSVEVADDSRHEFTLNTAPFTVAPGATHTIPVTFSPESAGDRIARLVLLHNMTPMGDSSQIQLTGRGIGSEIEISPTVLDFGSVALGRRAVLTLTVANSGNQALQVSSLTSSQPAFTLSASSAQVAGGAQVNIDITFTPVAQQAYAGTLTIASNDPIYPSLTVALSGVGLAPGTLSQMSVRIATSSTVELAWPRLDNITHVKVFVGPEPPASNPGPLPLQKEVADVVGTDTGIVIAGLAPAAHTFFYLEGWGPANGGGESIQTIGTAHALTVGGPRAALDNRVREVHLYAPNILAIVVTDPMVHSYTTAYNADDGGIDYLVGFTGAALQAGPWTVHRANGSSLAVTNVYRQSIPVGQPYYDVTPPAVYENRLDVDHWIYLVLDAPVGSRELLEVTGPVVTRNTLTLTRVAGQETYQPSFLLPFSDQYLETPALQVNQVGYCPRATERYAYVCGWMGDGGSLPLTNFPATANVLVEPANPMAARTQALGSLTLGNRSASIAEGESELEAGGDVRDIDLSALPQAEGTVYRVRLPGVGVSWPTAVSETGVYKAYYVTTRGLFLNRWGRDLQPQWTDWSPRNPDHPIVFRSEKPEWWLETSAFTPDTPQIDPRPLAGGHHDAGDFDIRPQHFLTAMLMMRAFELNEGAFTDGQLDIPESGNGIPDFLDEILYSLKGWEDMQEGEGGVRAGAQSYSHPQRINYGDADPMPYWVFAVDAMHTMRTSAMFAEASRLVRPYNAAKADDLEDRAIRAHGYALSHGITETLGGPFMYAAGELFRATGDPAYRTTFETMWNQGSQLNYGKGPVIYGFASWGWEGAQQAILLDYVLGYLTGPDKSPAILNQAVTMFDAKAQEAVDAVQNDHAHRNARPANWDVLAGHGTAVGEFLMRVYARMQLAGEAPPTAQQAQDYLNAVSLSADFVLGCNPQGMVWITGLGSRHPHDLLMQDSLTFTRQTDLPVMPGIPVYGYGVLLGLNYYDYGKQVIYPAFNQIPLLRRFIDIRTFVTLCEFTVWQTQAPQTALFGTLLGTGLQTPEAWRPGHPLHRSGLPEREDATAKK